MPSNYIKLRNEAAEKTANEASSKGAAPRHILNPGLWFGFRIGADWSRKHILEEVSEVVRALEGILEIGKRDMSNPKYDGYFRTAKDVLNRFNTMKGGTGE